MAPHLSTLLQRWGRAGRRTGMKATAILLVEASTIKVGGSTGKRKADTQITPDSTSEQPAMDSESLPGDYKDPIVPKSETPLKQIKINGEVVEKALVDFVMMDECRRKVLNRHYGNDTIDEPPPCCDRCNIPPPSDNCDGFGRAQLSAERWLCHP
jgi:superfamily II DNA helicase RecQ